MTIEQSIDSVRANYPKAQLWLLTKKARLNDRPANYDVDYWAIGEIDPVGPEIGKPFNMSRYANEKNPEGKWGWLRTSLVASFNKIGDDYIFDTANSTYELKKL